jgi:hypothetical protein
MGKGCVESFEVHPISRWQLTLLHSWLIASTKMLEEHENSK